MLLQDLNVHVKKHLFSVQIDRVIKGDLKLFAKDPDYKADVELFLNFGKNNNDKISFSTSNRFVSQKLLDNK